MSKTFPITPEKIQENLFFNYSPLFIFLFDVCGGPSDGQHVQPDSCRLHSVAPTNECAFRRMRLAAVPAAGSLDGGTLWN